MYRKTIASLFACVVLAVAASASQAAEPAHTEVAVEKMCCKGCAQKIASKLYTVRGVKEVKVNIPKKLVFVIPTQSTTLSPKAVWEAVEAGEDTPIRLACPQGTFTQKPRF